MRFSSWVFTNDYLYLKPYPNSAKAVDILNDFSHSEWKVKSIDYQAYNTTNTEDDEKSEIIYTIKLERYTHYYTLTMGMTITLVYVSFLIMFLPPDNISRTSTAVFIPLTILALQLTIIDKVPVVGYYTLMDKFFLSCFISSMMVSMISAIIYALISHKSHKVLHIISKFVDVSSLEGYNKSNDILMEEIDAVETEEHEISINKEDINIGDVYSNPIKKQSVNSDKEETNIKKRKESDPENIKEKDNVNTINTDYKQNIIKTINYDNKLLDLSDKELILYKYLTNKIKLIDNCLRIWLPFSFTLYIAILLESH